MKTFKVSEAKLLASDDSDVDKKRLEFIRICKYLRTKYSYPSNYKGIKAIVKNWLIISLFTFIAIQAITHLPYATALPLFILCQGVIASRYRGFENLRHEASHFTLFKTKNWNRSPFAACFYTYPIFSTPAYFFKWHRIHHNKLGDDKTDPDMQQNRDWGIDNLDNESGLMKFYILFIKPFTGFYTFYWLKNTFFSFLFKDDTEPTLYRYLFLIIILGLISVFNLWTIFLIGYLTPFFLLTPIIRFYAEASEHINVKGFNSFWGNSRNNVGAFHQYFLHPFGDGFHQVHHALATIPFFNLKSAFIELKERFDLEDEFVISDNFISTINQIK